MLTSTLMRLRFSTSPNAGLSLVGGGPRRESLRNRPPPGGASPREKEKLRLGFSGGKSAGSGVGVMVSVCEGGGVDPMRIVRKKPFL